MAANGSKRIEWTRRATSASEEEKGTYELSCEWLEEDRMDEKKPQHLKKRREPTSLKCSHFTIIRARKETYIQLE
jgi:hypothetical protein